MPQLTPVDATFAREAPQTVHATVTIAAPPERIWAALDDTAAWPAWFPRMTSAESTSEPPTGLGATRTVKVGPLLVDERIVAYEPFEVWGFTVLRTNLPMATRMLEQVELEPVDTPADPRTVVRYTGAFEPHPFARPTFRLVKRSVERAWTRGLTELARRLTAEGAR